MRRGLFQDYANQVTQMAVGWRLEIADLPLLAEAGKGTVEIDLLSGVTTINGKVSELAIYRELSAWLREARLRDQLPEDALTALTIRLGFEITEATRDQTQFRWLQLDASAVVVTSSSTFTGSSSKRETWTRDAPDTTWHVRDS